MKTHLLSFAVSAMLISATGVPLPAQPEQRTTATVQQTETPAFSFIRTHRQGKGVTATWGMSSTEGVVAFAVRKTYEDPSDPYAIWEDVGSVIHDGSRSYDFTDANTFPGSLTYRISASLVDGSTIESPLSTITIVSK